jgi:hypothetical protein
MIEEKVTMYIYVSEALEYHLNAHLSHYNPDRESHEQHLQCYSTERKRTGKNITWPIVITPPSSINFRQHPPIPAPSDASV